MIVIETFLRPHLRGARFEGHSIPLDFLKDLAVLEDLIVDVAKWVYLQDHPDRQRSPRNFTDGIELKLTGIDEGSAVPIISLCMSTGTLFPPDQHVYYEQARDRIFRAIDAAAHSQSATDYLPERTLAYFDRFGRGLRDDEAIEFLVPDGQFTARLTKETRRRLVLASSAVKELTEETEVRGSIPEADQDKMSFQIQLADGRKIPAPLDNLHLETVLDAFKGYLSGMHIRMKGIGKFSRNDKLLSFETVEHMTILEPLDVQYRLDELRLLKNGWCNGEGSALSKPGLKWISDVFERDYPDDAPMPYLYPTVEGGLQAEWTISGNEISLEINLDSREATWHCLNMETNEDEVVILPLEENTSWEWVIGKLRDLMGAKH